MNRQKSLKQLWEAQESLYGASMLIGGMSAATIGVIHLLGNPLEWNGWGLICFGIALMYLGGRWLLLPNQYPANETPK